MITYQKRTTETIVIQVFFPFSVVGGTVTTEVVVSSGIDSDPNVISLGPQNLQNNRVDLLFSGGIAGVVYEVFVRLLIAGDLYENSFLLAVISADQVVIPPEYLPVAPDTELPGISGNLFYHSTLYPIEGPVDTESAELILTGILIDTEIILVDAPVETEIASIVVTGIVTVTEAVPETLIIENSSLVLNSITIIPIPEGSNLIKESAEISITAITVVSVPQGDTILKESAAIIINSITVNT